VVGLNLLILLAMAHFVCDFTLQSDRMALEKVPGKDVTLSWRWWITAHAGTHGLAVGLLTGIPLLGALEWGTHILIDWSKSKFRFSLAADQVLHLACKCLWVLLIAASV